MKTPLSLADVGENVLLGDYTEGKIFGMSNDFDFPFLVSVNGKTANYDVSGNPKDKMFPIILEVIHKPVKKKIIQISTAMIPETDRGFAEYAVTALCDDGSVYVKFNNEDWKKLPEILEE